MFSRCLSFVLVALYSTVYADPQATRDDIEIRRILNVSQGTVRIAKDPHQTALYTLRQNGAIDRIDLATGERTSAYSRDDHGIRSGFTGFAIGPDGSFYLASNRRGPRDSGQFALVRGTLLDADTGERQWEQLDPDNLPADVPIDDILAATSLGRDPTTNTRYALKPNGDITLVPSGTVYTAADHGFSRASALFIDDAGTFYVLKRIDLSSYNIATITKGEVDPSSAEKWYVFHDKQGRIVTEEKWNSFPKAQRGQVDTVIVSTERTWFTLAETKPYERCDCIFNHEVNGLVVSPDNRSLFINSGSRTDHGEIQDGNRQFPGLRETALTAIVLRVPTDARDLVLPNDRDALRAEGFLYAEGLRNAYDLAFAPNGDLFATENGPDRDMAEELNWLREGHHYGFPWRMGLEDTPQQFSDYDPATDFLLPARFTAVREGYYHNDPTYPPPPRDFTEPVINLGPDADTYRDPADGQLKDASEEGVRFGTFTAHRSPLGLVFDADNALAEPFQGDGFVLSWTEGDPDGDDVAGPFNDPSEDLLHLDLAKVGDNYEARVTRIVGGFSNPIDAEIIGNRIYVIEWSSGRGLWEITLPEAATETAIAEAAGVVPAEFALAQNFPNPFNASTTIAFQLGLPSQVEFAIYNTSGQRVRTLFIGSLPSGHHRLQWDGSNEQGESVASGAYLYQLSAGDGDFVATRQLTLLK